MMIIYWARKCALINRVIGLQPKYQMCIHVFAKEGNSSGHVYKNAMIYVSTASFFSVTFSWNMFLS